MKFFLFLLIIKTFFSPGYSIFDEREVSARSFALGGTFVGLCDDIDSIYYNPAGLVNLDLIKLSFSQSKIFDILDYRTISIVTLLPKKEKIGVIGLGIEELSFNDQYKETKISFSHGIPIISQFSIGYSIKSLSLKILSESTQRLIYNISCFYNISEKFSLGLISTNFTSEKIANEEIEKSYKLGFSYKPLKNVIIGIDIENINDTTRLRGGIELTANNIFVFRSGVSSHPMKTTLGFGLNLWKINFDYGVSYHSQLDFQHILTVGLYHKFPKKVSVIPKKVVEEKELFEEEIEVQKDTEVKEPEKEKLPPAPAEPVLPLEKPELEEVTDVVKKINLNKAEISDLLVLDIPLDLAREIVQYRKLRGKIRNIEELLKLPKMTKEIFNSIKDKITVK